MVKRIKLFINTLHSWNRYRKMAMISIEFCRRAKVRGDNDLLNKWSEIAYKDVQGMIDHDLPWLTKKFMDAHEEELIDITRLHCLRLLKGEG